MAQMRELCNLAKKQLHFLAIMPKALQWHFGQISTYLYYNRRVQKMQVFFSINMAKCPNGFVHILSNITKEWRF